ncbi:MAG: diadenylate cyclase CdaA [Clostridia bacterium]|nr:diadenylate cyclase CdaA [Clostridia bacterium]MBR2972877.1 diadenylate cyclase CdaA [Clostridia bacterium]MBR3576316.1 diadenylate cyclase CdaA [Clostridia bacterium]
MAERLTQSLSRIASIGWMDIIDILVVAYVVYKLIQFARETRAGQLLKGIVLLVILTQVSGWLQLNTVNYILLNAMQVGVLALVIVFQPELRRALDKIGRSRFGNILKPDMPADYSVFDMINAIKEAVGSLSLSKTGALIVVERETKLGEIIHTGTTLDAAVSPQMLENIFFPNSPLHDGAVILKKGRIAAASCYLPLTNDDSLNKQLGTRHRAAIGISETADCVAIVVSEETGKISLALGGDLTRNLTPDSLAKWLEKLLLPSDEENPDGKSIIKKVARKWSKNG